MKLAMILIFFLSGCAFNYVKCHYDPYKVDVAMADIWQTYTRDFMMNLDTALVKTSRPSILWVKSDCANGRGFTNERGTCDEGEYFTGADTIDVVCREDHLDNETLDTLAHETFHYFLFWYTGDPDPRHLNDGWKAGGIKDIAVMSARDSL